VYVTDWSNRRIQVFDSNGTFLRKWYVPLDVFNDIAIDSSDKVYVSTVYGVKVYDGYGTLITQWSTNALTNGITVDMAGNVYVVEPLNNRITIYDSNGAFLGQFGSLGYSDGKLYNPFGIAVDSIGRVYVTDTFKVQVFEGIYIPPMADAGPDQTVECVDPEATTVTLDGSGSSDRWKHRGRTGPCQLPDRPDLACNHHNSC